MSDGKPINVNEQELDALLRESEGPVLLDLWAPWCAPCRAVAPALDSIAKGYEGQATVAKVNIDEAPEVARRLGVSSIPTLVVFDRGAEVSRHVGVQPESALARALDSVIDAQTA